MINLRISDLISEYCLKYNQSIVYYEIKYCTTEERNRITEFYKDKVDEEYINAMINDDDCFFAYNDVNTALQFAEFNFPTKREIVGENGDDFYYVFCSVYDNEGRYVWDNTLL
jgi:hypothetical protein